LLKGINSNQSVVKLPTEKLQDSDAEIPVLVGTRMARNNKLNVGDPIMMRWRDTNGTFDAAEGVIAGIFKTTVPNVDNGQLWIPLSKLQEMLGMAGESTIIMIPDSKEIKEMNNWVFRDRDYLLTEVKELIKTKKAGGSIFYVILLLLAMLAIFDTQVLSVFRRQKEIGTYVAMGMTRGQVVSLFTVEGAMHSLLAIGVAAVYGIPFLIWQAKAGFAMPAAADDYGLAITERIFPQYGIGLVIATILIITITATIVSYLPARKISRMRPTDALKGKIQ
jgi:ABC-type lipoprotein release transport system permease subunit